MGALVLATHCEPRAHTVPDAATPWPTPCPAHRHTAGDTGDVWTACTEHPISFWCVMNRDECVAGKTGLSPTTMVGQVAVHAPSPPGMHWKGSPRPPPAQPTPGQSASFSGIGADSNRPQPLRQPPPTTYLTASGAISEAPSLLMPPCTPLTRIFVHVETCDKLAMCKRCHIHSCLPPSRSLPPFLLMW